MLPNINNELVMSSLMWTLVDETVIYMYYLLSSHSMYARVTIILWVSIQAKVALSLKLAELVCQVKNIILPHFIYVIILKRYASMLNYNLKAKVCARKSDLLQIIFHNGLPANKKRSDCCQQALATQSRH